MVTLRKRIRFFLRNIIESVFKRGDYANDESLENSDFLLVSLGSICFPAGYISETGLRKCGYMPFDWICSKDGEKLIEILKDDFAHFDKPEYFLPFCNHRKENNLLHTYYHLEFVHDQDVTDDLPNKFIPKYKRRIDRFRKLHNYNGKVIFIRCASGFDPDCYWQFPETSEISDEKSKCLYQALKERFPNLKFGLATLNLGTGEIFEDIRKLNEPIWITRFNPKVTRYNPHEHQPEVRNAFKAFFLNLLNEKF